MWRWQGIEATLRPTHCQRPRRFSPDGHSAIVAPADDSTIRGSDAPDGRERLVLRGHIGLVKSLVRFPDGRVLVSGNRHDHTFRAWT